MTEGGEACVRALAPSKNMSTLLVPGYMHPFRPRDRRKYSAQARRDESGMLRRFPQKVWRAPDVETETCARGWTAVLDKQPARLLCGLVSMWVLGHRLLIEGRGTARKGRKGDNAE